MSPGGHGRIGLGRTRGCGCSRYALSAQFADPVDLDVEFASYHSSVSAKGNVLHYEREYVVRQVEIPAEKAPSFRKLEGTILADEKGTVVLKKQ